MAATLRGTPDWYLNSSGGTNIFNAPVTTLAGDGLLVCVFSESDYSPTVAISSVVWDKDGDNQQLTLLKRQQLATDNRYVSVWWLPNPTSAKVSNLTITYGDQYISRLGVMTRHVIGHDSATAPSFVSFSGGFGNTSGNANYSLTESINSVAGNLAVDFFAWRNDVSMLTAGAGQGNVSVQSVLPGSRVLGSSSEAGAATNNFTWQTNDAYYGYAHIIVSIPAGAAPPNNPPTFPGNIANITGVGGTPISPVDVHSAFSDTDTLTYSASPAGTAWPSGLAINSTTGVINGAVAAGTYTGLKVRATDTASQTVDSNAFNVTISAPASTVTGVTVSPTTATVNGGASQTFTASVTGTNSPSQVVNWSVAPAGSITAGGVFTAPAATSSAQTITITAASAQDNTKAGRATVTVPAAVSSSPTVTSVTVTPGSASLNGGAQQQFSASVAGTNNPAQTVTWTTTLGTIDANGLFTAPAATSSQQTLTVTATSTVDGTKKGTSTITVAATASGTTSYVDFGVEKLDNIQSGLQPSAAFIMIVIRRDDLSAAKQVVTGVTSNADSTIPRFATTFPVGTPVHVIPVLASDNTVTGIVSDHVTVA